MSDSANWRVRKGAVEGLSNFYQPLQSDFCQPLGQPSNNFHQPLGQHLGQQSNNFCQQTNNFYRSNDAREFARPFVYERCTTENNREHEISDPWDKRSVPFRDDQCDTLSTLGNTPKFNRFLQNSTKVFDPIDKDEGSESRLRLERPADAKFNKPRTVSDVIAKKQAPTSGIMTVPDNTEQATRPFYMNKKTERSSYGVACTRFIKKNDQNVFQILMIQKRHTYAYQTFVYGKYNSKSNYELIQLFSGMTVEEKLDILSMKFDQIWYRIWLGKLGRSGFHSVYANAKFKFENAFGASEQRLRSLINRSTHARRVWEIPKGRKKYKNEPDIQCAVREFQEETGVTKYRYKLYPTKTSFQHTDDGVKYTNNYFIAIADNTLEPTLSLALTDQLHEVADIQWMTIEQVDAANPMLTSFVKRISHYVRSREY